MYFFLGHLAFLDMCYSSITLPKILVNLRHQWDTISYRECLAQIFFLMTCAETECALLTVMAFDRYAAICKPLHYTRIMSKKVCVPLATVSWLWGILNSAIHNFLTTNVSFCGANQIHHIFCDIPPLLKIACSDTYINEMALHAATVFVGLIPFLLVLISYAYILLAILRIRSNMGRHKAFSTCAAHLVVVIIYFGTAILNYNKPSAGYSVEVDTLVSTLYCILTPMLNPLIYSLRNQDVKGALRRALGHHKKDNSSFGRIEAETQPRAPDRIVAIRSNRIRSRIGLLPARTGVAATGPMDGANQTQVTEFVFLGFSRVLQSQAFLFLAFLAIYLITLLGNCLILTLIVLDPQLHSPMYFFLGHLAFLDMSYSSVTVPKILVNFVRQRETISYRECMAQMFFLMTCAGTECALLTVMAFDRYAAICKPLHYTCIMSKKVCVPLASACWLWGILNSTMHTSLATDVSFCGANQIHHIFCDVPPLLKIACSDTYINEMALHAASIFVSLSPFLLVLISYVYILAAILRIRSKMGRRKAFSTCTSHLIVVIIYFGMAILNYNRPSTGYSLEVDTLISTLYCIITPMLNPLIYSLRNQDVRGTLKKVLGHKRRDCVSTHGESGPG
ncbi:olfactory receptor 2D3-like [Alligator mississippiensis]|uniref:olfactory receptor 2D3-like n=1 Tax=Alligator mississippiensis TaxID=8496 RepID=UPI0028774254|nr:olfactory receptor 2D3-like [Alligator mississippiensis]